MDMLAGSRFRLRALAALAVLLAIAIGGAPASAQRAFYTASPQEIAGPPGTIIRAEPMLQAPGYITAFRVLYRSRGLHDEPIAVSGVIIAPRGDAPAGGRPVVAWAHPTTGVVTRCAPSLAFFVFQQIDGLREMAAQGYAVAASDYPGLGAQGVHPYLVGVSEARAVLDIVRAARTMPEINASNEVAIWGHSQGGQAALFAGLIAKSYAPELKVVGVAVAAPATELATLMQDDLGTAGGNNLTAMTLWSWDRVFGAQIGRVVTPQAIPAVNRLAEACIESIGDLYLRRRLEKPLEASFLTTKNPTDIEPWRSLAKANTPGVLPASMPLFVAQGTADHLVRPAVTADYVARSCRAGLKVIYLSMPGVSHGFAAQKSAREAVAWMAGRFAGEPPPDTCGQ
jgi:acetyl esterase/lipase